MASSGFARRWPARALLAWAALAVGVPTAPVEAELSAPEVSIGGTD